MTLSSIAKARANYIVAILIAAGQHALNAFGPMRHAALFIEAGF